MNITWINHRDISSPNAGGAERTIYEVGRRLVAAGNSLTWLSVASDHRFQGFWKEGIKIIRLPSNIMAHLALPLLLKRTKADIIVDDLGHAVPWGSQHFTETPGTVFFRHLHARSLHGQVRWPLRGIISAMEKLYPYIYDSWPFVAESSTSIADLEMLGISGVRISKIQPGVDTEFFRPAEKTEHPSVVYFGGFRDYKRPWESLFAFRNILKEFPDARMTAIGNGPAMDKFREVVHTLSISSSVHIMGRISSDQLREIVARSWVNIHSSTTEGFGYSILEASACGTPTVAYSVPGVAEAIETGKNGITVLDGDSDSLADAANKILGDFSDVWVRGARKVAEKYSWDATSSKWEQHLIKCSN